MCETHAPVAGRFRDRASWHGNVEYRFWVIQRGLGLSHTFRIERIGAAVFYESGSVGSDAEGLFHASVQHSYGFSLICSLERLFPFRMDFGFSKDGLSLTLGSGLSF